MIQFNLLPDVKLEFIKARRTKHIVMLTSILAATVTVSIAVVMFVGVRVIQQRHLDNLNEDIHSMGEELRNEKDIDKILTVQSQLNSLNGLHDAKPAAARLGGYISRLTPTNVALNTVTVDYSTNTIKFEGAAVTFKNVNEFIDTMKFATYTIEERSEDNQEPTIITKNAFTSVVLTEFDRTSQDDEAMPATFMIDVAFDPILFDIKQNPTLNIRGQTTTRSVTERPDPRFQPQNDEGGE